MAEDWKGLAPLASRAVILVAEDWKGLAPLASRAVMLVDWDIRISVYLHYHY